LIIGAQNTVVRRKVNIQCDHFKTSQRYHPTLDCHRFQ
jgi:hypothetical protein